MCFDLYNVQSFLVVKSNCCCIYSFWGLVIRFVRLFFASIISSYRETSRFTLPTRTVLGIPFSSIMTVFYSTFSTFYSPVGCQVSILYLDLATVFESLSERLERIGFSRRTLSPGKMVGYRWTLLSWPCLLPCCAVAICLRADFVQVQGAFTDLCPLRTKVYKHGRLSGLQAFAQMLLHMLGTVK